MTRTLICALGLGALLGTVPVQAAEDPGIALPPVPRFTTQQIPAVALGILEKGLSWERILKIQKSTDIRNLAA